MFKILASQLQAHFEVSRVHKCYGDALHHIFTFLYGGNYCAEHISLQQQDIVAQHLGLSSDNTLKDPAEYLQLTYTYNWFVDAPYYYDHPLLKECEPYDEDVLFSKEGFCVQPSIQNKVTSSKQYILTYDICYDSEQITHSIAVFQYHNGTYVYNRGTKVIGLLRLLDSYCDGNSPSDIQFEALKNFDNTTGVLGPLNTLIKYVEGYFDESISLTQFETLCKQLRQDIQNNVTKLQEYVPNLIDYLESIIGLEYDELFPENPTIPVTLFAHPYKRPQTTQLALLDIPMQPKPSAKEAVTIQSTVTPSNARGLLQHEQLSLPVILNGTLDNISSNTSKIQNSEVIAAEQLHLF